MLEDAKSLLKEMIRNKCINPPGGEIRNIQTIKRYLDSYGIASDVFESAPERGNLFAEIEGTCKSPSLMFGPSHVDVVPVQNEESWSVPPFEGIEKDGCIWGRGALDMLFFVACQTVVFAKLHEEGFKPKGTLKLLIVADEEASGGYGAKWMIENHPEKVRVDYLLTEQGGEPLAENRIAYWYGEKGFSWSRISFGGQEQHGSTPYSSNNAIVKMGKAIEKLSQYQPPRDTQYIKPILDGMGVGTLTKKLAGNTKTLPKLLSSLKETNLAMARFLHALTQMTISPNIAKGGTKVNVVPGEAYLDVDIRLLPGQDENYVLEQLRIALEELADEARIENIPLEEGGGTFQGSASVMKGPFVEILQDVVKQLKGSEYALVPLISTGATDARFFREAFGTQAYGFAVSDDALDLETIQSLFHGDDERVSVGTINLTIKAYYEVAKHLLT